MSNCIIAPIPIQLLEFMWEYAVPHLAKVVEIAEDEISLQSIKSKLLDGSALLLLVLKDNEVIAAITAERITYENGMSALVLPVVGGDELDEWMEQVVNVTKLIAKDLGCQELRGLGARKGWIRKLKDCGWKEAYSVMKCKID